MLADWTIERIDKAERIEKAQARERAERVIRWADSVLSERKHRLAATCLPVLEGVRRDRVQGASRR